MSWMLHEMKMTPWFVSSEHAPDVPMPSWHSQQLLEDMQKQKHKMLEKLHPFCKRIKTLTLGASSGVTRACHEPEQESVGWGRILVLQGRDPRPL